MGSDLSNRTAIVTGGSGFLGRDIVAGLRAGGCKVVILDCSFDGQSPETDVIRITCNLADPIATEAAVRRAWDEAGPIPILVNAVGSIHNAPLINVTAQDDRRHSFQAWRSTIDANLTSVFLATVNHVDRMVAARTRGVVVSLSSVAAAGNAGQTAYSAAKAGVNAMTSAWAKELGVFGIRFVAVAPGFVDTASTHSALSEAVLKDLVKKTPLRRLGQASEITSAVLFAVDNEYLTGKVLEIDGGITF
jgi:3-oxoacyl-[acyl-carrier protein] reductase